MRYLALSLLCPFTGIVGDWRNHFTVAQNDEADQINDQELEGSIFKYDYIMWDITTSLPR